MLFIAAIVAVLVGAVSVYYYMKQKQAAAKHPVLVGGWTSQAQAVGDMHAEITNDIRMKARAGATGGGGGAAVDDGEDSLSDDGENAADGAVNARRAGQLQRRGGGLNREEEALQAGIDTSGMSKKDRLKALKKHDKEGRKAAQDAALEHRRENDERREREDRERKIRHEQTEAQEEAALKNLREEKKRAEDDEYRKWAGDIKVEAKGEAADAGVELKIKNYLIAGAPVEEGLKVLELEATSRKFNVSVERITEHIEKLLLSKELIGIFDERGSFFYITVEELRGIKAFIEQRGRVSLETIAEECNRVISV